MDREQYIAEAHRQLNNQEHYTTLEEPLYKQTALEIGQILQTLVELKHLTKKQAFYLRGEESPRPRIFYLLPKIHKAPETWPLPYEIPPGRPIVSDCNSESYRIAEYLDHFLNPISKHHPSYIKDTYDFVAKVRNATIQQEAFLFTIDIDSLYTNIETTEGLKAVREWFLKYPDRNRPETQILKLLEISLNKNDFEFEEHHYLQIKGTAMGKRFAPAYADIYMAHWEATVFPKCTHKPTHYFRYLDDIWGTWTHGPQAFQEFINTLNTHHRSIKLKYTKQENQIDFLDTTTYKGSSFNNTGKLDIKVYFKDTDTHGLLHKDSFHPKHTFKGLVKSQLLRFHKICTQQQDFEEAKHTLFQALRPRGYTRSFLRNVAQTFLNRKTPDDSKIIPLITTYSQLSVITNQKLKSTFTTILENTNLLREHKIISAYRKNKNLQDYLVQSKLKPVQNRSNTPKAKHFKQKTTIQNNKTKEIFQLQRALSENTNNAVYGIQCKTCGVTYVGETGNSIRTRLAQHRYNIRNQRERRTHLVAHFLQHGLEALEATGLESNPNWTEMERKKKETEWIKRLHTTFPQGLNIRK